MPQPYATTPSDPRRFVRRHRYQEGHGFLFLATQNGRPANDPPRPDLREIRRRMRAVRVASQLGIAVACSEVGCSVASVYRWLAAFEARGTEGLVPSSRRPLRKRPTIPSWVDRVIITIRLLTYWNSKRISAEMRRRQIYEVSHPGLAGRVLRILRSPGAADERQRPALRGLDAGRTHPVR
jgi:transposase